VAASFIPDKYINTSTGEFLSATYSSSTWQRYNSAVNSLAKFEVHCGLKFQWPLGLSILVDYATWALSLGSLKSSTVDAYLNMLKTIHKLKGLETKNFDSFLLKSIIRGKENLEMYDTDGKGTRKVMTLHLLKLLGHEIAKSNWKENSKQVVWAAMTLAFFGSLRCGEILANGEKEYCKDDTLLWGDLKFYENDHILIHIKNAKSRYKGGEFVDIFEFKGHGVCPVEALKKLRQSNMNRLDSPVFCFDTGICLTRPMLNKIVKKLLTPYLGKEAEYITGHSFRAGIPAVLARYPEICSRYQIMGWGRWKSDAYLLYTRLKIDQKRCTFVTITQLLNK